jgi:competence transcription factor ComK
MKPSKEYLDHIIKRLEAMNPGLGNSNTGSTCNLDYKMPSFEEQVGRTAMEYLKNKKDPMISPDPLFPDRN